MRGPVWARASARDLDSTVCGGGRGGGTGESDNLVTHRVPVRAGKASTFTRSVRRPMSWMLVVGFWLAGPVLHATASETVATVNGERVRAEELQHWMLLERADVARYFYREHGVRDASDLWRREFGGESPAEMLRRQALEKLVRIKVQQLLAVEKGILASTDFRDIMEKRNAVNRARQKRIDRGGVVYGPKQFSPRTYFDHVFDRMVEDLKAHLAENDFKLPEADMRERFREQGLEGVRSFERIRGALQMQYVDEAYEQWVNESVEAAKVRIERDALEKISVW